MEKISSSLLPAKISISDDLDLDLSSATFGLETNMSSSGDLDLAVVNSSSSGGSGLAVKISCSGAFDLVAKMSSSGGWDLVENISFPDDFLLFAFSVKKSSASSSSAKISLACTRLMTLLDCCCELSPVVVFSAMVGGGESTASTEATLCDGAPGGRVLWRPPREGGRRF